MTSKYVSIYLIIYWSLLIHSKVTVRNSFCRYIRVFGHIHLCIHMARCALHLTICLNGSNEKYESRFVINQNWFIIRICLLEM